MSGGEPDPLVSVIVPCYRQGRYLADAVDSVIAQDHERWECIIIDDGSPDDTRDVAATLARRDSRVRYVAQSNQGQSVARNNGIAQARGDLIQFLDADDLLFPGKLTTTIAATRDAEEPSVVISDYWLMDEKGSLFENPSCTPEFLLSDPLHDLALRWETELSFPPNATLFDARFFRNHGVRFCEKLRNHEDWDCWMRLFTLRPRIARLREKQSVYRVHSESMTRHEEKNWQGFRQAIDRQINLCANDPELRRMLVYKRKLTDDFYGKTLRVRALGHLKRSAWFRSVVPPPLQRAVLRRLDLSDLDAHGWRDATGTGAR